MVVRKSKVSCHFHHTLATVDAPLELLDELELDRLELLELDNELELELESEELDELESELELELELDAVSGHVTCRILELLYA